MTPEQEKKLSKIETTTVTPEQMNDEDFIPRGKYYIITATGDYCFIHTRSRQTARQWVTYTYGYNKYNIKTVIKAAIR